MVEIGTSEERWSLTVTHSSNAWSAQVFGSVAHATVLVNIVQQVTGTADAWFVMYGEASGEIGGVPTGVVPDELPADDDEQGVMDLDLVWVPREAALAPRDAIAGVVLWMNRAPIPEAEIIANDWRAPLEER